MSAKKEELGKGIRALLGGMNEDVPSSKEALEAVQKVSNTMVPLGQIEVNPFQPRADFDKEALEELADSIRAHGVIQPITVRALGGKRYQLISGERRLRASKMAGLPEVPVFIRKADDQEMLEIALIENIQREDLNAIEIAINYKRLIDECSLTQEAMAGRLGKNRTTVTNYLRLLKLPPDIQKSLKDKAITMGHARAMITVDDADLQLALHKETVDKGLSVRQVEELVKRAQQDPQFKKKPAEKDVPLAYRKIQDQLSSLFSTKVQMKPKAGGRGEIVITYYSDDDLDRILEQFNP